MRDQSPDAKMIAFEVYEKHGFCTEHKSVKGGPSACPECKEIDETDYEEGEEVPPKGRYWTERSLTRKWEKIGDFITGLFVPLMRSYKYHQYLRIVLGKNYCIKERLLAVLKVPGSLQEQKGFCRGTENDCQPGSTGLTLWTW